MDVFLWGFKQLGNSAAERVKKGACHYLSGAMRQLERVRGGGGILLKRAAKQLECGRR